MKSPYLRIYFLISVLSLIAFCGEAQHSKEALKKSISIQQSEIRLDSLMRIFSRQSGFEFSFNSKKILPTRKVIVGKKTQTVAEWLIKLKTTFGIQHKIIGNHIILVDNPKQNLSKSKNTIPKNQSSKVSKLSQKKITNTKIINENTSKQENETLPISKDVAVTTQTDSSFSAPKVNGLPISDSSHVRLSPTIIALKDSSKLERVTPIAHTNKLHDERQATEEFRVVLGYSKHGSGDMKGVLFGGEYSRKTDKRFFLTYQLRGGFNSDVHKIIINNTITGTVTDASIRFNTGGVQAGVLGSYNVIRSLRQKFQVGLGIFGRYQSTSNDGYALYYPNTTGVPTVLVELYNWSWSPQHTIALGGIFQLQYQFYFSRKMFVGVLAGFQTDTNGDAIPQVGLVFGRHLRQ